MERLRWPVRAAVTRPRFHFFGVIAMAMAPNRKPTPVETGVAGKIIMLALVVAIVLLGYFLLR